MFVNSPLDINSLGTRSTFQSLTRPYFFHGSSPGLTFPYFLNNCNRELVAVELQTGELYRTVSMLMEAASLR